MNLNSIELEEDLYHLYGIYGYLSVLWGYIGESSFKESSHECNSLMIVLDSLDGVIKRMEGHLGINDNLPGS